MDLKLLYIKAICNTYPPTISTIAFTSWKTSSWDEHLCRARLFPVTTKRANGIQAQSALLYPFHNTKTESVTNDNSKITTPSMNLYFQRDCIQIRRSLFFNSGFAHYVAGIV